MLTLKLYQGEEGLVKGNQRGVRVIFEVIADTSLQET